MLTYDSVLHAPLGRLKAAADRWRTAAENLATLEPDVQQQIVRPVTSSGWSGEDATAGLAYLDKVVKEVGDAATAARGVQRILDDAYLRMKEAHDELVRIRDVEAPASGLAVRPDGTVEAVADDRHTQPRDGGSPGRGEEGERAESDAAHRAKAAAFQHRVDTAVEKAKVADEEAARALRADAGGNGYDFRAPVFASLDAEEAGHAADLAARGEHMTTGDLLTLDSLLNANHDDTSFAADFATRMGPEGTLRFWTVMANPVAGFTDRRRDDATVTLQKLLSRTLATATRSGTETMRHWKREMIGLGDRRVPTRRPTDITEGPYGFQVMGCLMRQGCYDTGFLKDYGARLLDFERHARRSAGDLWLASRASQSTTLNLGGVRDDVGHDPMTGFMEALGHNPAAATDLFRNPDTFHYLTGSGPGGSPARTWPLDATSYLPDPGSRPVVGYDCLGHALEAATTGAAYDAARHALHRTDATSFVANEVITGYGANPALIHTQSGIADSIGRVGAAYIDDIDNAMLDGTTPGDPFPAGGRAYRALGDSANARRDAIRFLSTIGQDRTAHGIVSAAQHTYTASMLLHHPPTTRANFGNAESALFVEAHVRGILDHARVGQVHADLGAASADADQELARSTDYIKIGTGTLVGIGVGLVPVPGSSAVGAAVVPIATDTVGQAFSTFLGHRIDDMAAHHQADTSRQAALSSEQFFTAGTHDIDRSVLAYLRLPGVHEYLPDQGEALSNQIHDAYQAGGTAVDEYQGEPAFKKD